MASTTNCIGFMATSSALCLACGVGFAPTAVCSPADPSQTDQERHGGNVGELQRAIKLVDVFPQLALDVAQLAPQHQHLAAELLDGLFVLLGQHDALSLVGFL